MDAKPPDEFCPTCGSRVVTITADEGTSYLKTKLVEPRKLIALMQEKMKAERSFTTSRQGWKDAIALVASVAHEDPDP